MLDILLLIIFIALSGLTYLLLRGCEDLMEKHS
jgi:hypothetical protein